MSEAQFDVKMDDEEVNVSLADLAGIDMNEIEEYEGGFEVTPKGAYVFLVKDAKLSELGDYAVIAFELEVTDCMAVASEEKTTEQMVGVIHEENIFITDVKKSVGQAKFLMRAAGYTATGTLNELLDGFCGTKFAAKVKQKPKKNDPDTIYANIDMKSIKPVAE